MFDLGFAFYNTGEVNFLEGAINNRSKYQNIAGIVNLAFACELFIKCLLNMAGSKMKSHNIEDLWREYKGILDNKASEIESSVMEKLSTELSFEDMLHSDRSIFNNYRYLYEAERLAEIHK
jgi:hypothetical protein